MCNPADYFMTMLSAENAIDDDDDSDERVVKIETQIVREYTKKIKYLHDKYLNSDLRNDYAFKSSEV